MESQTKTCQNCKTSFTIEPDDFSFYEKMGVPAPTWCPECRQTRRVLFRNFKTLYKRPSSKSGKMIVSMYAPDVIFPVYEVNEWWADDWDASSYAKDIDWSRSFLEQVKELHAVVPRMSMMNTRSEDCEYSNMTLASSNCYLVFGCIEDEECDYGHIVWNSKNCVDNLYILKSEFCYECVDCLSCNSVLYRQECESCADSIALYDCRGCTNCIGCVGLRNQSYHIFNTHVSKEEYAQFLVDHPLNDLQTIQYLMDEQKKLRKVVPTPCMFGSHNTDVSGNHIYNAGNIYNSFDVRGGENGKYGYTVNKCVDSYDVSFSPSAEKSYESLTIAGSDIYFSHIIMDSAFVYYSDSCFGSQNIFGCAGLRQKKYCILNKEYSKEEYEMLVPKITEHMKTYGEWGEFFPISMSPFAYNEAIVNEYHPKSKAEALADGFRWRDDIPSTSGQETMSNDELPKDATAYDSALLSYVLKCDECSKNYRFIDREIAFYKRFSLALPRKCFNCRHKARMAKRNLRVLHDGTCQKCGVAFKTSFNVESQKEHKVYCVSCYQQEIL
jgi:hypothetical protein